MLARRDGGELNEARRVHEGSLDERRREESRLVGDENPPGSAKSVPRYASGFLALESLKPMRVRRKRHERGRVSAHASDTETPRIRFFRANRWRAVDVSRLGCERSPGVRIHSRSMNHGQHPVSLEGLKTYLRT